MKFILKLLLFTGTTAITVNPASAQMMHKLSEKVRDGYYFFVDKRYDSNIPPYGIKVKNSIVISDHSDDKYGCTGVECSKITSISRHTKYVIINSTQILRETPDKKKVILTWFKPLEQSTESVGEINSRDAARFYNLYIDKKDARDLNAAIIALSKAISLTPDSAWSEELGDLYFISGKYTDAIENYSESLRNRKHPQVFVKRGRAFLKLNGNFDDLACRDFIYAADSGDQETYNWLSSKSAEWCVNMKGIKDLLRQGDYSR